MYNTRIYKDGKERSFNDYLKVKNELEGLAVTSSMLENDKHLLNKFDIEELHERMKLHFEILDRYGVTFLCQNTVMKYAKKMDTKISYLNDIMNKAMEEILMILENKDSFQN